MAVHSEIWLKREDLCHTGAHKINNSVGQALLARELGKHPSDLRARAEELTQDVFVTAQRKVGDVGLELVPLHHQ